MPRLVLTRKLNESVIMHNDDGILATIKISRVTKNQVRLSFEAEEDIKIDREERYESQIQDK